MLLRLFMSSLATQIVTLILLAIPVACIAWTVTHEEAFREPREFCVEKSKNAKRLAVRKFFYLFTCEYCFSHYVTLFFIIVTGFKMLYPGWVGYVISFFSVVWIANIYMTLYGRLRVEMKSEGIAAKLKEVQYDENKGERQSNT